MAIGACPSIIFVRVLFKNGHASSTVREASTSSQEAECKSLKKILTIVIFIATVPNKFASRPRLLGSLNYIDKRSNDC